MDVVPGTEGLVADLEREAGLGDVHGDLRKPAADGVGKGRPRLGAHAHHGVELLVRRIEDHDLGLQRRDAAHDIVDEVELHPRQQHVGAETAAEVADLLAGHLGVEAFVIVQHREPARQLDMEAGVGRVERRIGGTAPGP